MTLARKLAKWKAYKAAHREGTQYVDGELEKAEERQNAAIDRNIMIGEDHRSLAYKHHLKILELQEIICYLRAAPTVHRMRYLELLT